MAITIKENRFINKREKTVIDQNIFGKKVGLIGKIFGCSHQHLSRPISRKKIGYRSCLSCGALKQFDTETLRSFNEFYYPQVVKADVYK